HPTLPASPPLLLSSLVVLAAQQLAVDLAVAELPVPLAAGDVDLDLRVLIQGGDAVLGLDVEEEQDHDDQNRNGGEHQLKRNVIARLTWEFFVVTTTGASLAGVATHDEEHQGPHDDTDDPGGQPDPDPVVAHLLSLRGNTHRPAHAESMEKAVLRGRDVTT